MPEVEPPFRPREKLLEVQRYFQNIHKHTYLKGRYDAITSVGIPLALAASCLFLIGLPIVYACLVFLYATLLVRASYFCMR